MWTARLHDAPAYNINDINKASEAEMVAAFSAPAILSSQRLDVYTVERLHMSITSLR
jgi:hypothetical protein